MKKILFLLVAFTAAAFANDGEVANQTLKAYSMLAAGLAIGTAALGGAIGMGSTAAATIAGTARNPGLGAKLMTTMFHRSCNDRSTSYLCTSNCVNRTLR